MVAPIIIGAAVVAGGVAVSVIGGYAIDKIWGDGNYTTRELAIDAALGLVPGAAVAKPVAKIGLSARYLRWVKKSDAPADVLAGMAWVNRHNFKELGMAGATTVVVGGIYDSVYPAHSSTSFIGTKTPGLPGFDGGGASLPGSIRAVASRKKKTFVRCNHRNKGRRCILRRGHSGSHRYKSA